MQTRRNFLISGALLATALASNAAFFAPQSGRRLPPGALDKLIPRTVGQWLYHATDGFVLSREDAVENRTYDDLLTRVYAAEGLPAIMLLVAYSTSQNESYQLHRPESCYPAAGFELSRRMPATVGQEQGASIPAQSLTASAPRRQEQILYWTRVGDQFPMSYLGQKVATVQQQVRGGNPDGVLVRISSIGGIDRLPFLQAFAALLLGASSTRTRTLLTGLSGAGA